ncbi:ankyrin repeat domain-containing protein [Hoyosella subflava]|uniref:Ankyrin n=1 Tax=Hoyosella subflava (strain DSM 45089 / JCM 17490 / NBRC 109087 / DQS3-9A1) TaxID=443218 RepID=F6EE99_HOYSD|nr:ankyrin repeat domain-containing protein [Hoyosella subflava]AEF38551.1 Ankyrin [Hoyosella subflava DQS3-9A1]
MSDAETDDAELAEFAGRLFDMARRGDVRALAAYLDAGVPANLSNGKGDTLLMLAAYHGHAEVVTLLVERGADVDQQNDRGQTPLAGAVFKGEDEIVATLVRAGADPYTGVPPAIAAATMFGREDYVRLLESAPVTGPGE